MRVVDEPVQDGVGDRGIGDHLVPVLNGELAGHDGTAATMSIVDDLQEVSALIQRQVGETPVIEDQQLDARDGLEQACMPAVTACECQGIEQPWQAMIKNRAIVAARRVCQRASDPTFTDAGRTNDDQVLMLIDPVSGSELGEQRLVEPARRLHIDVLDDGVLSKAGELQSTDKPLVLAFDRLAVDEHGEPFLEGKCGYIWLSSLFFEPLRHAGEAERNEPDLSPAATTRAAPVPVGFPSRGHG